MKLDAAANTPANDAHARLRTVCHELEGVFLRQLFAAMRESTGTEELAGGSAGEEMFTSMLDDHLATEATGDWTRGLGEAMYRQLARHLGGPK